MSELSKVMSDLQKEELVERWKESGLLMGLPKEKLYPVAHALEEAANHLIHTKESYDELLNTWLFPVIRRLYANESINEVNLKALINELNIQCNVVNKRHFATVGNKIDYEAEYLVQFCDKYAEHILSSKS